MQGLVKEISDEVLLGGMKNRIKTAILQQEDQIVEKATSQAVEHIAEKLGGILKDDKDFDKVVQEVLKSFTKKKVLSKK